MWWCLETDVSMVPATSAPGSLGVDLCRDQVGHIATPYFRPGAKNSATEASDISAETVMPRNPRA